MLLLLLGLAGGSVMAGEPVVERQAGMKIKPGNGIRPARLDRKELARQKGMRLDGKELDRMEKMPLKEASAGMKQRKGAPKRQAPTLITEQPEGELTTYWRSGGCISSSYLGIISTNEQEGKFYVVINGTKAYIKNPSWYVDSYNTWVSGTYNAETGIISIPTGQYLYWNETNGYGIQMMWGSTSGYKNEGSESYSLEGKLDESKTEISFQIDEEAETITLLDSEGNLKANLPDKYNATGIYLMWDDDKSFIAIEFNTKGEVFHAVPANPTNASWYDCGDESGYSKFSFTLPTTDVDGNPIDPEKLSYSIYTDEDQIFTFSGSDYTFDLEKDEEITEVPYGLYSEAVDFKNDYVYLYRTNEGDNPLFTKRIGIQVHYTVDGVKNSSEIVYLYPFPAVDVNFVNDKDNSDLVAGKADKKADATIEGRTIFAGGKWNTLCLPFDLDVTQLENSPLAGFEVKELDVEENATYDHITGYEKDTKTLWLNFKDATRIEAGKPYLVRKPAGGTTSENITNPVFENVIIKNISPIEVTSKDKTVTFVGTYAPVVYEEENKSVLFLQGEKLYYPDGKAPTTINSFRAYFPLNGIYGGTPEEAPGVHNFVLNFGDGETTGIMTTKQTNQNVDWYSIDGRKLNQKPQQRGIYISNGRKVMVK